MFWFVQIITCKLQNLKTPKEINEDPDILPGEVTAERLAKKMAKPVLTCKKKKEAVQQEESSQTNETDSEPKTADEAGKLLLTVVNIPSINFFFIYSIVQTKCLY